MIAVTITWTLGSGPVCRQLAPAAPRQTTAQQVEGVTTAPTIAGPQ
ncbi:hypothetical protein [Kitasatospora sp. NPDC090091]